ncbi:hypothetical protein KOR42_07410 [Thalassoglobus neptunius]|uniref:SHOCT domain-containing protein n=1 Tax=Thalassoglobus neptunius TaxID=1938619 RepID=A0A5C5X4Y5_9PLAN|nr:DUF4870 domain-containing protein [Thalassoglobus neptunius]TWT57381.1 hypothetical protein KOR42_07410 [Thalassoglobus neptunius]
MAISDEIERLAQLRDQGRLSDAEFQEAKAQLLSGASVDDHTSSANQIFGLSPKSWCMLMHFSQLLNCAPGAGMIAPVCMWVLSKDQSIEADRHGAVITNWVISSLIYSSVFGLLMFVVIGIPLMFALVIALVVFPIIGGVKASNGELWHYPMSIEFITVPGGDDEFTEEDSYF